MSYEPGSDDSDSDTTSEGDKAGEREREEMRKDKRHERQREKNLMRAAPDRRHKIRAAAADEDRDISEQIALGLPSKKKGQKEVVYDQRLWKVIFKR